jgi:threonine synthase
MVNSGVSLADRVVVCVITGTGLKDPTTATEVVSDNTVNVPPDLAAIEEELGYR